MRSGFLIMVGSGFTFDRIQRSKNPSKIELFKLTINNYQERSCLGLFSICTFCTALAAFQAYTCIIFFFYSCLNFGEDAVIKTISNTALALQMVGFPLFLYFIATTVNSCHDSFKKVITPLR